MLGFLTFEPLLWQGFLLSHGAEGELTDLDKEITATQLG